MTKLDTVISLMPPYITIGRVRFHVTWTSHYQMSTDSWHCRATCTVGDKQIQQQTLLTAETLNEGFEVVEHVASRIYDRCIQAVHEELGIHPKKDRYT